MGETGYPAKEIFIAPFNRKDIKLFTYFLLPSFIIYYPLAIPSKVDSFLGLTGICRVLHTALWISALIFIYLPDYCFIPYRIILYKFLIFVSLFIWGLILLCILLYQKITDF